MIISYFVQLGHIVLWLKFLVECEKLDLEEFSFEIYNNSMNQYALNLPMTFKLVVVFRFLVSILLLMFVEDGAASQDYDLPEQHAGLRSCGPSLFMVYTRPENLL